MRFACRTPKATKPRSECAILFTPQQHFFLCTYITYVISFSYMCSWGLLSSGNDTASLDYRFQKFWNNSEPIFKDRNVQKGFFFKLKPLCFLERSVTDNPLTRPHITEERSVFLLYWCVCVCVCVCLCDRNRFRVSRMKDTLHYINSVHNTPPPPPIRIPSHDTIYFATQIYFYLGITRCFVWMWNLVADIEGGT